MEDWNLGDIIDENKTNKLLIIRGTTDEITAVEDDNITKGSVIFDETQNEILLNIGTSSSIDWENFDTDPIGMIKMWPSNDIPNKWKDCNGEEINRTTYSDLFDLIASQYGSGDGSLTFNLPDMNHENFIRTSNGDINLGVTGGEDRVTLTLDQLPAHKHEYPGTTNVGVDNAYGRSEKENSSSGSNGSGGSHENKPEYINTQWIIKVL